MRSAHSPAVGALTWRAMASTSSLGRPSGHSSLTGPKKAVKIILTVFLGPVKLECAFAKDILDIRGKGTPSHKAATARFGLCDRAGRHRSGRTLAGIRRG